jgi:hypothetical protein
MDNAPAKNPTANSSRKRLSVQAFHRLTFTP